MFIDHGQCRFINWLNNRPHTYTHKSDERLMNKSKQLLYIKKSKRCVIFDKNACYIS